MKSRQEDVDRKERRNSKFYDETMWRIEHGYILNRSIFETDSIMMDKERHEFFEKLRESMKEGVKRRFKEGKKVKQRSFFPKDNELVIRCPVNRQLTKVLDTLMAAIDPEEIYSYDPLMNGSGYKYYKGERVIVYQINKYMSQKMKKRIENQICKTKVMNLNRMIFNITNVYKIVIVTGTKWEYHKEGRPEYSIENGYSDTLNILTHQRTGEKRVLDQRREMTKVLIEINKRFL